MRNILFTLPVLLLVNACSNLHKDNRSPDQDPPDSTLHSELQFRRNKIDFGSVPVDTVLTGKYDFLNPAKDTLIITSVNPDCTCTGYTLSREKIPPGDSGYILMKVSTKNKSGAMVLYSTVSANTPTRLYSLKMTAHVR